MSLNSPFVPRKSAAGVHTGGKEYVSEEIYLEYVETGRDPETGKSLGSVQPVIHVVKTDIQSLIDKDKNSTGVKNILSQFTRTGDESLFKARQTLPSGDYSVPGKSVDEIYKSIPDELKQGRSVEQFLSSFTQEELIKFAKSKLEKESEVKADGE